MIKYKNITFIITTFKSEKLIEKNLKQLPSEAKKIVIENSSNKFLKKKIENKFKNLKCYVMSDNLGYGKANNFGIKKVTTRYYFILNPDAILTIKNLDKALSFINNIDFSILGFTSSGEQIKFSKFEKIRQVKEVKGFALLVDKTKIKNIMFDENIFLYLEEIDFCRRVISKGGKIYLANIRLKHLGGQSHGGNNFEMEKSRNWHWMWSQFYFKKKYTGLTLALIIFLPKLFLICIKKFFLVKNFKKKEILNCRFNGLLSSIFGLKSNYRPKL